MKYGILIGRFQPPHYGHMKAIQKISKRVDKAIIILVSTTKAVSTGSLHPARNPFTFQERKNMILNSLDGNGFDANNIKVISFHPILSKNWKKDLSKLPKNRFWYLVKRGNIEEEAAQILKERGETVKRFVLTKYMRSFSSKEIRKRIIMNENWDELVPNAVKKIILEVEGTNRVRSLYKKYGDVVFTEKEDWLKPR